MSAAESALLPETLPIIDLGALGTEAGDAAIARQLDAAFGGIGFAYFANTPVTAAQQAAIFAASRRFHALPEAEKRAIDMNGFHRGYMAPKTSVIATSSVARVTKPNYSESFMFMHEVPPEDPRFGLPLQGPNQWPEPLPDFRAEVLAYQAAMEDFCRRLLRPIALALNLPGDYLLPWFEKPTTFLRLLHYPPQPPDSADDEFGSAPHTDYGFITVLVQDMSGGLEVRRADGVWLKATPIPGSFVVNVGDMLARWTNGRWQSTPHRVKNLSGGDRYSCPYFFDMDMGSEVACLPSCTDAANPPRHPPVLYGDYLLERLNKNYAYRQEA
ncbi:isopenicillin N synthase family dioxygenase [Falsiroseomonas tokyonensis]|uniref:Isopenicillin N synthase family dioxygenase n=1 Tax=Falsiroseomonas tokyonensis TaxID=430521 RepID=A0ABV7BV54_9PROT|nr:2OG-Fe(II) oxygenase family protein [Falsiroseomonas tokyonensis]MBU8539387.1 isopenicillin N synthase family oxygenase [Falsiroseomonas tokyonensis]